MENQEVKYLFSSFIENMIEHVFISEMLQEAWLNREYEKLEVLRSEVDDSGYDIVLSCNGVTRYIQLKTSEDGGSTIKQKLNISLAEKENACIVWIVRKVDEERKRFKLKYLFFGADIGKPFPNLDEYTIAKHSKGNSKGEKKERPNIREIPRKDFVIFNNSNDLFDKLFK